MLLNICLGLFAGSSALLAIKNVAANNRIERMGNIITPDHRSFPERFISAVKDYTYLFIPGLNIIRSIKKFVTNDAEYTSSRLALLQERERIQEAKQEVSLPEANKNETVKESIEEAPVKEVKKVEKMNLHEQLEYYRELDAQLRGEHDILKEQGASIREINAIVDQIEEVDAKFYSILRKIKLAELKEERDNLVNNNVLHR